MTLNRFKQVRWKDINTRTVNGSRGHKIDQTSAYFKRGTKLNMSRVEFDSWCDRNAEVIINMIENGESPSVDRLDPNGDYELSNIQIIPMKENADKGRRYRWDREMLNYCNYVGTDLGKSLKRERAKRGFTQRSLGKETGISYTHLNQYENNRMVPSLFNMIKIAKVLHLSLDEFFAGVELSGGQGIKKR